MIKLAASRSRVCVIKRWVSVIVGDGVWAISFVDVVDFSGLVSVRGKVDSEALDVVVFSDSAPSVPVI
jgi:hypothetical protein